MSVCSRHQTKDPNCDLCNTTYLPAEAQTTDQEMFERFLRGLDEVGAMLRIDTPNALGSTNTMHFGAESTSKIVEQIDALREALRRIVQWSEAYPEMSEPYIFDPYKDMSIDELKALCRRHVRQIDRLRSALERCHLYIRMLPVQPASPFKKVDAIITEALTGKPTKS